MKSVYSFTTTIAVIASIPIEVQSFGLPGKLVKNNSLPTTFSQPRSSICKRTTLFVSGMDRSKLGQISNDGKAKDTEWPNALPTNDESFQQLVFSSSSSSTLSSSTVSLPKSSSNQIDANSSPLLRSVDSQIQKVVKKRNKYRNKVAEYDQKMIRLNKRRQQYLNSSSSSSSSLNQNNVFSESTLRSAAKALLWRIIAGSITLITSLKLSNNNILLALKVVGSDFFSKVLTMFIGERLMNKSQAGRINGSDSKSRSVVKALIWRLFAVSNTLVAVLFFGGGDLKLASKIAGSDAIFKTTLMVFYERAWAKIEWGKDYLVGIEE